MSDTQTLLRENIRRLRARAGFTQAELAERCGLSPNYIAELEAGRRFPSATTLDLLATVFKVMHYELFWDEKGGETLGEREPQYAYKERLKRTLLRAIEDFD